MLKQSLTIETVYVTILSQVFHFLSLSVSYSFDARGTTVADGKHWRDEAVLKQRAYFHLLTGSTWGGPSAPGAHLELFPVKDSDQESYRCRVDYLLSPTKNTIVNFTVISEC